MSGEQSNVEKPSILKIRMDVSQGETVNYQKCSTLIPSLERNFTSRFSKENILELSKGTELSRLPT